MVSRADGFRGQCADFGNTTKVDTNRLVLVARYALDKVNRDDHLLPNISLGYAMVCLFPPF